MSQGLSVQFCISAKTTFRHSHQIEGKFLVAQLSNIKVIARRATRPAEENVAG
jgi:hypothetical protein